MTNPSGIKPVEYNVLVKPKEVEEKTAGGLIIPQSKRDMDKFAQEEGEIIAFAPLAGGEIWPEDDRPKEGDTAVFAKYAGTRVVGFDDEEYRLMKDKDILAVKAGK